MITLPPLPEPPSFDLPDPANDPHAYNVALHKIQHYRWLLSVHQRRECAEAQTKAAEALGLIVAKVLESLEYQTKLRGFLEFEGRDQVRVEDTAGNRPARLKASFDALLAAGPQLPPSA